MRLLDRYLLRELLVPLLYCLGGFVLFWVFFDLFIQLNTFQSRKLHAGDIVEYYLLSLPGILVVILPIALLLALLYTLTNHARHHEITAIRSAGISLWRLCVPYLVLGFLGSLVLFWLNEFVAPDGSAAADDVLIRREEKRPGGPGPEWVQNLAFNNSRDGRTWKIGLYNIETGEMKNPIVIWNLSDGSTRWLAADRAVQRRGIWYFYNVREYTGSPDSNSTLVPLVQTNVVSIPAFTETPGQINSEVKLANANFRSARRADVPLTEIRNYLRFHPTPLPADRAWLFTKLHGRLAAPWTCFVVVLMAIPFAAASGRRNVFVGVASSIVICFAFFVVQQLGLALGSGGLVPAWVGAWFPNLSFAAAGLIMTARVR
jgi:lipopolysaccharide export system permease protein